MSGRLFPCEHCGTEGRIYSGHPNDPHPRDEGECPVCQGTCSVDAKTFVGAFNGDDDDPMLLEAIDIIEADERAERDRLAALRKGGLAVADVNDDVPF